MQGKLSVSPEERYRAVLRSRRMYQTDLQSDFATAEDRGKRIGQLIGERRGKRKAEIDAARNLLKIHLPLEQIAAATGLTMEEAENLRKSV